MTLDFRSICATGGNLISISMFDSIVSQLLEEYAFLNYCFVVKDFDVFYENGYFSSIKYYPHSLPIKYHVYNNNVEFYKTDIRIGSMVHLVNNFLKDNLVYGSDLLCKFNLLDEINEQLIYNGELYKKFNETKIIDKYNSVMIDKVLG